MKLDGIPWPILLEFYWDGSIAKKIITDKVLLEQFDDFITYLIVGVILGGRMGYIVFYNLDYYLQNPIEIFMIWYGGMSFHGGLIGVIVGALIFSKKAKLDHFIFLDLVSLVAPIGIFFGRIANFLNSELYGRETSVPWSVEFILIDNVKRHPSQIYEAIFEGIILFLLLRYFTKKNYLKKPGLISALFLIFYSLFRFFIEFFRSPDPQMGYIALNLTFGQFISVAFLILGGLLFFYKKHEN